MSDFENASLCKNTPPKQQKSWLEKVEEFMTFTEKSKCDLEAKHQKERAAIVTGKQIGRAHV